MVALLRGVLSITMENISFHNTGTEEAFVGALLLGKLDPGGVGFANPGHGSAQLHISAAEGLACGCKICVCSRGLMVSLKAESFAAL